MEWDFSCKDWETKIRQRSPLMPALPLDKVLAEKAVTIFNKLKLPDVPGTPALQDAAGEWFRDIVRVAFGSLVDGRRMVPELFILAPKKSSKTSYSAALMLTALILNKRPRAELLFVAPSKLIAELAYNQAVGMISEDETGVLKSVMHVRDNIKEIRNLRTGAKLVIKSFDHRVLVGIKPVAVLVDELWEIARSPKAVGVLRQIRGGLEVNKEGLLIFITTQSDEMPRGVFKAELQTARAIRDGEMKGRMLPVLYEFPKEIAENEELWSKPENWDMVNPNLGRPVPLETLVASYSDERAKGIEAKAIWCSQHLNIEIGTGLRTDRWAGADFWAQNAAPLLTLDELLDQSDVVTVGIDGGGLDDLLGLAVLGRSKKTRDWLLWSHAWAHNCVLERRKDVASYFKDFQKANDLTIIPDESDRDVRDVVDIVLQIEGRGLLPEKGALGVDRVGITDIIDELELRGFDCSMDSQRVIGVNQGWPLTSIIKTTERKLAQGALRHGGAEMMNWCVKNCKVESHGNSISITKQQAGSAKIDPVVALFDAAFLMARNPDAAVRGSYLDKGPVLVLG